MPAIEAPREGVDFESLPWNMNLSEHANMVVVRIPGGPDAEFGPESYDPASDTGMATQVEKYGGMYYLLICDYVFFLASGTRKFKNGDKLRIKNRDISIFIDRDTCIYYTLFKKQ